MPSLPPLLPISSLRFVPDEKPSYTTIPATDEHEMRINLVGIEAPLLRPSLPPRYTATSKKRNLSELPATYKPARFRLVSSQAAEEKEKEKDNLFFDLLYVDIYAQVRKFADGYFGLGDIHGEQKEDGEEGEEGKESLWCFRGREFGEKFLGYAGSVARQDNNLGGWEDVLATNVERVAMVCGILGKALQDGAWDALLFGAGEEEAEVLRSMDEGLVESDGYERTAIRAQTINSFLGDEKLPTRFWEEVDLLTARILELLLPLLDLMDGHFESSATTPLAAIHADLHAILAEAGYLAVCMRRSSSVFRVVWPMLGDSSSADHEHEGSLQAVYKALRMLRRRLRRRKGGTVLDGEG